MTNTMPLKTPGFDNFLGKGVDCKGNIVFWVVVIPGNQSPSR